MEINSVFKKQTVVEVAILTEAIYSVQDIADAVGVTPQQVHSWRTRWADFPPASYTAQNGKMWLWDVQRATKAIRQIREYQRTKQR